MDGSIFVSYKKISSKGSVMVVSFLNIFLKKKFFIFILYFWVNPNKVSSWTKKPTIDIIYQFFF